MVDLANVNTVHTYHFRPRETINSRDISSESGIASHIPISPINDGNIKKLGIMSTKPRKKA